MRSSPRCSRSSTPTGALSWRVFVVTALVVLLAAEWGLALKTARVEREIGIAQQTCRTALLMVGEP